MPELRGFAPPFTPTGRTALAPPPPWHYSGKVLTVEYRTDVDSVRAVLPAELDLAAHDHRLATARLTITGPAESNGFVNAHPMVHHRQVRGIERGAGWVLDEVVTMTGYDADLGPAWAGTADLELADSPWDELATLLPVGEVLGGYYRQIGVSWNGGTLAHR